MNRSSLHFHKLDFLGALASGFSFIALNILLQVALVPLYLQSLGKTDFGILMIVLSAINFLGFGVFGLTGNVLRNLSLHAAEQIDTRFAESYTRARYVFGLYAVAVALCALAAFLSAHGFANAEPSGRIGDSLTLTVLFGAAYFIAGIDFGIARIALSALHQQTAANLLHTVSFAIFGALAIPWILFGGGMAGVTGAMLIGTILARGAAELYIRKRELPARWLPQKRLLSLAFHEYGGKSSRPYLVYGAIFIIAQSDSVILGIMSGPEVVADFILLWKVAEVLLLILSRVPEHLQPAFARVSGQEDAIVGDLYRRSMFWLRVAATCAGVGYAVCGPWIVAAWVGDAAAPQGHLGYVLAGGALFWLAVARNPAALANVQGGERQRALIKISASEVLLKITLMLALVPYTAAYAPLIAINLLHLGGYHYLYARLLKPNLPAERVP